MDKSRKPDDYKRTVVFQLAMLTVFSGLFLTCKQPCNRVQDVNHGKPLAEYNNESILNDTCWNGQPKIKKRISVKLAHWNACNLDSFDVNLVLDYGIVYSGKYHREIPIEINPCNHHCYDLQIVLIDEKKGVYYRWQNKSAYVMSGNELEEIDLVIYPQRKFDYSNGKQYDIERN